MINTVNLSSQLSIAKPSNNKTQNMCKVNILVYSDNLKGNRRVLNNGVQKGNIVLELNKN